MAELNKLLSTVKARNDSLSSTVQELLESYEELYRDAYNQLMSERISSNGSFDGLEEFHRLVNIVKRNRDVVGSIHRGLKSLRSLDGFAFIEEDIAEEKKAKETKKVKTAERKKKRAEQIEAKVQAPTLDELIEGPPEEPVVSVEEVIE